MMMPCSRAAPSRGGPAARSRPCAAALAASLAMLASYWSRVMYPGWAPGMKEIHSSRGSLMLAPFPAGQHLLAAPAVGERAGVAGVVQHPQHGWWRSGCQSTSPLRGPFWCRQGKVSPAARNAFTTAVADPVASNVASRCRSAPWMAVSGSRMTCPAAS